MGKEAGGIGRFTRSLGPRAFTFRSTPLLALLYKSRVLDFTMPPRSRSHSPATYPNSIPLTIPPQAKRKTALAEANFPIFFILIIGLIGSILYQRYQSPGLITKTEVEKEAIMAELKVGDTIPEGTIFSYIPYTEEKGDITACGIPINYDASKGRSTLPPFTLLQYLSPQIFNQC